MRKSLMAGLALAALALFVVGCASPTETTAAAPAATASPSGSATVLGTVGGYVVDAYGKPLAGVPVSANTGDTTARAIVHPVTDSLGWFEVGGLISGPHTIVIGDGVAFTTRTLSVEIPSVGSLIEQSVTPVNTDTPTNPVATVSAVKQYDGHFYVTMDFNEGSGKFTVYPLNATLTGKAFVKVDGAASAASAVVASAGTKVFADFSDLLNDGLKLQGVVGSNGTFSIPGVPALGTLSGSISFYLVSDDGTTTVVDSVPINGSASNSTGPNSISTGDLLPLGTRDLGPLYFVEAIAPKIVGYTPHTYDPYHTFPAVVSGARTNLVLTFDKAMDTTKGTVVLSDGTNLYRSTVSWNLVDAPTPGTKAGTVLTITPLEEFPGGTTITPSLSGFYSTDDVALDPDTIPAFNVAPALSVVDTTPNMLSPYGANYGFPITGTPLKLTFNKAISRLESVTLTDSNGLLVEIGTPVITGTSVAISPSASLKYNRTYSLNFTASADYLDGTGIIVGKETFTSAGYGFTTVKDTTPVAAPSLAFDSTQLDILASRTTYNNGDSTVYLKFTNAGDPNVTYEWSYRLSSTGTWTTPGSPGLTPTTSDSLLNYASVTIPAALVSGESTDIRVKAINLVTGAPSTYSGIVTVADTTAPVGPVTPGVTGTFNNSAGTTPVYATVTVSLAVSEPIGTVTLMGTTTAAATTALVRKTFSPDKTVCTLLFKVPATASISGSSLVVQMTDAAGNVLDNNTVTAGQQDITFTLP